MKQLAVFVVWCLLLFCSAWLQAAEPYDHAQTGYPLEGAHRDAPCESCHARGVFELTPKECSTCHDRSGLYADTARSLSHPLTTNNCEACHITANWITVPYVEHGEVFGACSSCHDGVRAEGKPADHPQTTAECDTCHIDASWSVITFNHDDVSNNCVSCHNGIEATGKSPSHLATTDVCEDCHSTSFWDPVLQMDHSQVLGSCVSCHNGMQATGKSPDHILSDDTCDDCHITSAWLPAVFDHQGVAPGSCASCHNGVTATGKDAQHLATSASCDLCHSTIAWVPAMFDHSEVAPGSCSSCHDGVTATGQDPGHFQTSRSCDDCHDTSFWTPDLFTHSSPLYPDHGNRLDCTDCHTGNSEIVTWTSPAYQPDCAGCHANDFRSGPHKKHENPDVSYTVAELQDCTGSCHVYTDSTLSTIQELRPGPEHSPAQQEW